MSYKNRSGFLWYAITLAGLFIVLFLVNVIFGVHYTPKDNIHEEDELHMAHGSEKEAEIEKGTELALKVEETETPPAYTEDQPEVDGTDGLTFYRKLKTEYEENVLSKLPKHKARTDVVVRYYHHAPDGTSAYALSKLGYYIHERPVAPQYADFQSNAVYYGDSVKLEDVQLVTFTLLNQGLPIKEIKSSRYSGSWKARSIEIGTDTTLIDLPTLTYTQVKNLSL